MKIYQQFVHHINLIATLISVITLAQCQRSLILCYHHLSNMISPIR